MKGQGQDLTQDIFRFVDDEVKSAAIDSTGVAWFFSVPKASLFTLNTIWGCKAGCKRWWIGEDFNSSHWKESAIDRIPETA